VLVRVHRTHTEHWCSGFLRDVERFWGSTETHRSAEREFWRNEQGTRIRLVAHVDNCSRAVSVLAYVRPISLELKSHSQITSSICGSQIESATERICVGTAVTLTIRSTKYLRGTFPLVADFRNCGTCRIAAHCLHSPCTPKISLMACREAT
jgi:hypothetical protein